MTEQEVGSIVKRQALLKAVQEVVEDHDHPYLDGTWHIKEVCNHKLPKWCIVARNIKLYQICILLNECRKNRKLDDFQMMILFNQFSSNWERQFFKGNNY